jgi:FHS family L-fucose permease-like MFS transporter
LTAAQASDRYAIGQGLFAIGRFAAAGLMMIVKPRLVLMAFMSAIMLFIALAIALYGEAGIAMLSLVLFFESCVFPTIFTLSIRGLGRHTKRGSSWIVAAVSGGALFPSLTGLLADHKGYHIGMTVPLIGFFVSFVYPIFLNTVYKRELDGFRESKIGYTDEHGTIGDSARDARKASLGIQETGDTKVAFRTEHLEA